MDPEMKKKIDAILARVTDPESGLSLDRLGIVTRVRYNEEKREMYLFTDFLNHLPRCATCRGIAMAIMSSLMKTLKEEFEMEFSDITIELV
jgi:metal-sulfur cluster biosynthetic enzyme